MGKLRNKIALLVGLSVLLTLLIIMGAFNLIMHHRMQSNADSSMRSVLLPDNDDTSLYSPEMIVVQDEDKQDSKSPLSPAFYTPKERSIIDYCEDKPSGETFEAEIDGNICYIMKADNAMLESQQDSDDENAVGLFSSEITIVSDDDKLPDLSMINDMMNDLSEMICYIDITGELEVIRQINIVFLVSAFLIGIFGSTAGYFIGRKLEQNQLAQKQFFENTSHELKTPLTSIRGYAEGIEKGIITDYKKTGNVIAVQTEKMSRLVEEILCMAKLESGSVKPECEQIELSEFLQDCLMPFEGTVLSRKLEVSLDLKPMTVSADPDKLEHAVSNLITNALKYAQTKISISCGNGRICIENDCTDISEDTLSHMFERFYTGRDGNTGIGLSLAKELIELHGWHITVRQTEKGICFEVKCG